MDRQFRDVYFAADEADETVSFLLNKADHWFRNIQINDYMNKMKKSWQSYHGNFYENAHEISYGGEQGELVNLAVNHYRNLAQHMLVMVTSSRPSFQCRAINNDRKSLIQADLGNGLLDYYMREKRLERELKRSVEYAIVLGSGFVKLEWNSTKGKIVDYIDIDPDSIYDYDSKNQPLDINGRLLEEMPIYEGDVEFTTLSPFDVVFDPTKENPELHDWVLCRSFLNKYDLMAKYPEYADKISSLSTKSDQQDKKFSVYGFDSTQDIAVYEFYHKRTEALPEGRYISYLSDEIVLQDTIMPYRDLPLYRIAPAEILGTPYGYTGMFDLIPLQDALNSLYSTALTNNNAFGVQNILNPQGNNVKVNQMEGGLNWIEYNAKVGEPKPLQLTNTSPEVYKLMELIERNMETLSGINQVARGNPEASLRSGNALAMIQSQALQFMSGLQQSYIQLLEDVGTGLINILKDYAEAPRVAAIAGLSNATKIKQFKSDDLKSINRVVVDVGNALASTTAGRAQIAENLLQMGAITSPERYLELLNTGDLKSVTQSVTNELDTIRGENEALIMGEEVQAIFTDHHAMHIREHRDVLSDYELRKDAQLVQRTMEHIQEHITLLKNTDPNILAIIGEQPIQSPMPPDGNNPEMLNPMSGQPQMPNMPNPPGEFENLPQTPQEMMVQNLGAGGPIVE